MTKKVHVLYGVAQRDPKELVCMFFDNKGDMREFITSLPGYYKTMALDGVNYDALKCGASRYLNSSRVG